jgi:hypothetical protein
MKKIVLISLLLINTLLIQGCSVNELLGVSELDELERELVGRGVDHNCPTPSKDQLDENGYLMLQKGVTLKCQVKNYTNRMPCVGITDSTGVDGWVCNNREKTILFTFDENEILKDIGYNSRIKPAP